MRKSNEIWVKAGVGERPVIFHILFPFPYNLPWEAVYANKIDMHFSVCIFKNMYMHIHRKQYTLLKMEEYFILTLGGLNG